MLSPTESVGAQSCQRPAHAPASLPNLMLSFFTALMLFVRRAHARAVHIYRSILSAMTGNINSLRWLQSCQRPAHAPAPLRSPFLSFFKGLTSLVRPDHAGPLRVVFFYPPTHAIAFVRDVWSGLASGNSRHGESPCGS